MDGTPLGDRAQISTATSPSKLTASADRKGNAALSWREGDRLRILLVSRAGVAKGPAVTISGVSDGRQGWSGSGYTVHGVALATSGRLLATAPAGSSWASSRAPPACYHEPVFPTDGSSTPCPIYEYRCRDCGHRFEVLQRLGQGAEGLVCPGCGAEPVEKVFSTFAAAAGGTARSPRPQAAAPPAAAPASPEPRESGGPCGRPGTAKMTTTVKESAVAYETETEPLVRRGRGALPRGPGRARGSAC